MKASGVVQLADAEPMDMQRLKAEYLECLRSLSAGGTSLRQVVGALLELGVCREELVEWAVAAGYRPSSIRTLLSKLLCDAGLRRRSPGAGRRVAPEALALLALARDRFGERAPKHLLAAYRAAKARVSSFRTEPATATRRLSNTVTELPQPFAIPFQQDSLT